MLCIGVHSLGLDDGLGVVVIVFELEDVHQLLVRREAGQFVKHLCAVLGEGLLHLRRRGPGHVGIPAVRQDLGGVLKGGGVEHARGLLVVEKLRLPGTQHGRHAQIRFFFR